MATWVRTLLVTALAEDLDPWLDEHLRHLRELKVQGRLRAAGAFPRGDGYVDLFDAADLLEAEEIARQSPLVTRGLAAWTLREWRELDLEEDDVEGIAVLRTVATREEAEILRGVLEANGIEAFVASDDARGLQPPLELVSGVKLLVAAGDRERAEEALSAMESGEEA